MSGLSRYERSQLRAATRSAKALRTELRQLLENRACFHRPTGNLAKLLCDARRLLTGLEAAEFFLTSGDDTCGAEQRTAGARRSA